MRPITPPIAFRTANVDIAQELHLDLFKSSAAATFALPLCRIETERASGQPPLARQIRLCKELADIIKRANINHRIRSRRAAKSRLIHHYNPAQMLPALEPRT